MSSLTTIFALIGTVSACAYAAGKLLASRGKGATPPVDSGPVDRSKDAIHKAARPIVETAVERVLGRKGTPAELQYVQAVGYLETNYGRGWKGAMVGSNNWGAVQCPANAQNGVDCIPYEDSQSSGEKYKIAFRKYATPEDGATDLAKHVLKQRPITASVLADTSDGTVFRASYAMRRERYYGGFCPNATKQYGASSANASFGHPDRDAGTRACMQETVGLHAKVAGGLIRSIAAAVGETPMPHGTFEDADAWYLASHKKDA